MLNINDVNFDSHGLVPAIAVDDNSGDVLMLAYMNRESLSITLDKKLACFWSRSRNQLWLKGSTSGNYLHVREIVADCDRDTLLLYVKPDGPACHLGNRSCFVDDIMPRDTTQADNAYPTQANAVYHTHNAYPTQANAVYHTHNADSTQADAVYHTHNADPTQADAVGRTQHNADPTQADTVYHTHNADSTHNSTDHAHSEEYPHEKFTLCGLMQLIKGRKSQPLEGSYTSYLFAKGLDKILKKIGEESTEVVIAAKNDKKEAVYEISDLIYHLMVLMAEMDIDIKDIILELASRHVIDHKVKQEKMTQ